MERRTFVVQGQELRTNEAGQPVISGHAAVFNLRSEDLGGFREEIQPGAFAGCMGDDVRFLINHDGIPLARTKSGTLSLAEDGQGLRFEAPVDEKRVDVQALMSAMGRGDIDQCSFGFVVAKGGDRWSHGTDGELRTITKVSRLFDVSIVTLPAFPDTEASVRSLGQGERPEKVPAGRGAALAAEKRALRGRRAWAQLAKAWRLEQRAAAGSEQIPAVGRYGDPAEGSLEDWLDDLCRCLNAPNSGIEYDECDEIAVPIETFGVNGPGFTVVLVCDWWDGSDERYFKVLFDCDDQGEPVLGAVSPLQLVFVAGSSADGEPGGESEEEEGGESYAEGGAMEMSKLRLELQRRRLVA